jgi:hypothetical protein
MSKWGDILESRRMPITHPVYTKQEKVRGYNTTPDVFAAHGSDAGRILRKRLPGWTKEDHIKAAKKYFDEAKKLERKWGKLLDQAAMETWGRKWRPEDYKVSGVGSDEFPKHWKDQLRPLIQKSSRSFKLGHAHMAASKYIRKSRMEGTEMKGDEYLTDIVESGDVKERTETKRLLMALKKKFGDAKGAAIHEDVQLSGGSKTQAQVNVLLRTALAGKWKPYSKLEDVFGFPMDELVESAMGLEKKAGLGRTFIFAEVKALGKRALDSQVQKIYSKWFDRIQVNIFNLSKVRAAIKKAILDGDDLDKVMPPLVKQYREN